MKRWLALTTALLFSSLLSYAHADGHGAPFGGSADQIFGKKLWNSLVRNNLAGNNRYVSRPYSGQHPHGAVLDTIEGELSIDGERGVVIVKNNYGGDGASIESVADDPDAYLAAVTVMYQRDGYDADNNDWFWAKYLPDGSFDTNANGMPLVGRVAKGMPQGCIACHTAAPGGDLVFINDRY